MLTRTEGKQLRLHTITIEDLVPEDHFLRKLERHIDFSLSITTPLAVTAKRPADQALIQLF